MARRPNYSHERRERDRAKSAKRAARAEARLKKASERKSAATDSAEPGAEVQPRDAES